MMLEEVLRYLNNWFVKEIYTGTFSIEDGKITLPFLQDGQYFRIAGSIFNDGVYQYTDDLELKDEEIDGAIWALAIPDAVIQIANEIKEWQAKYGDSVSGPYTSESFGGYSYSKGSGSNGDAISWADIFKSRLAPWKKLAGCENAQPAHQDPPYHRPFNIDHPYGV